MAVPDIAARSVERALDRKRAKYEDEVTRLIDAAVAVMIERQTVDPTVSEIVARSGLSNAAFYRHFTSKDELVLATVERGTLGIERYLRHTMARVDDPADRIRAWVRAELRQVATPELIRANRPFVLAYPGLLERFPADTTRLEAVTQRPLEEAVEAACRERGLPPERVAAGVQAIYHVVVSLLVVYCARRSVPPPDEVDAVAEHCVRGTLGTVEPARRPSPPRRRRPSRRAASA